ncbi:uncharacterized protein LOC123200997 [Mangifera indica]|uniref:uncharacterized protein LOC123200997 n=1 Tax=Mangifera indica TaxID=29780 RepID=UPI001CF99977|nr:uncharacterized protein LOC123200997 [Mangifera indica]
MAPISGETIGSNPNNPNKAAHCKPRLPIENLQRTISDISFELTKVAIDTDSLPGITEVEEATCECCGMCEECTAEYVNQVREKFSGKMLCGLCSEAVNGEMEKNGGRREEALNNHMSACVRFNRFGRANPVLFQAEAMREMLRRSKIRAKSMSPREKGGQKKGAIARSSSCISTITKDWSIQMPK